MLQDDSILIFHVETYRPEEGSWKDRELLDEEEFEARYVHCIGGAGGQKVAAAVCKALEAGRGTEQPFKRWADPVFRSIRATRLPIDELAGVEVKLKALADRGDQGRADSSDPESRDAAYRALAIKLETAVREQLGLPQADHEGGGGAEEELKKPAEGLVVDVDALRASWNSKPLAINGNSDFKVLRTLFESRGKLVPYEALLKSIRPQAIAGPGAPPEVKEAVRHIRAAFKKARCPWRIQNTQRQGYMLIRHK